PNKVEGEGQAERKPRLGLRKAKQGEQCRAVRRACLTMSLPHAGSSRIIEELLCQRLRMVRNFDLGNGLQRLEPTIKRIKLCCKFNEPLLNVIDAVIGSCRNRLHGLLQSHDLLLVDIPPG